MLVTFTRKEDGRKATVLATTITYASELTKNDDGVSPGTAVAIFNHGDNTSEMVECQEKHADFVKLWKIGLGMKAGRSRTKIVKKKAPARAKVVVKKKAPVKNKAPAKKVIRKKK